MAVPPHQKRFEGGLDFPGQQILPVNVSEEGMSLRGETEGQGPVPVMGTAPGSQPDMF